jgi:hypothetical protein
VRKTTAIIVFLALVLGLLAYFIWPAAPGAAGRDAAERDIAAGKLRLKSYSPPAPPWYQEYVRLLQTRHGIEIEGVAGCDVSETFVACVEGYNERMLREIRNRFGADVLERTARETRPAGAGEDR